MRGIKNNRKIIYSAGFLFSLSAALMAYINSSFLASFVGEKTVGIIYSLGSVFLILAFSLIPLFFKKMGGYRFLLLAIGLDILSILVLVLSKDIWALATAFILGFALYTIIIFSLDEFLKIFSKDSITGKIRGTYLTVINSAWILSQVMLIFGQAKNLLSFRQVYSIALLVMVLFFLLSLFALRKVADPKYDNIRTVKFIGKFFSNRNLARAFSMVFLLQFFYCWMIIYTPIYLSAHLGFNWQQIGIIFAVMLLPFVLLDIPLGKLSDKVGERKMLIFGFLLTSIATFILFFLPGGSVLIWALALLGTRIGAATVEAMCDIYFFKHIEPENEEFVGVYRGASPLAYIIGPLLASAIFIFIPSFNFIFPILGLVTISGVYLSAGIKKSDI